MSIVKRVFLFIFGFILLIFIGFIAYYFIVTHSVTLDVTKLNVCQNDISIYDTNNELFSTCSASGNDGVNIENLPPYVVHAFISAEDKRFFKHKGLDYRRMAKALLKNVSSCSFKEGASTISQQLIKNTQLSPEKTINRKLKEVKLTRQLEKRLTKNEILQSYLNTIYFGHSCFGINNASKFYFNTSVENLSIENAALLAGLVKSPNNYSPFKNPENALKRRDYILKCMHDNRYITAQEKNTAKGEDLPLSPHPFTSFAENYRQNVVMEMDEFIGESYYGGLNVYTYLDENLQREIESLGSEVEHDVSLCVTDSQTRGVKAFYSTIGNAKRLPASTIKPLLVYAPAIEENVISPATPILDDRIDFGGYSPRNYDGKYHGYVSAREALSKSYNIPTVKILNSLGVEKGVRYLTKMGLFIDEDDKSLALALGGMKNGYSLQSLCSAYTTFACGGQFIPSAFIKKIIDKKGNVIFERREMPARIFGSDTTTLLNDILISTVKDGTAKKLKNLPYEVAAKTGTCGNENGNTDAYSISYTSQDVIGVWVGSADNTPINNVSGGGLPCNLNLKIHKALYPSSPPQPFEKSKDITTAYLDRKEYQNNHVLMLCDEQAPVQERTLKELFKKNCLPRQQSTYFSRPTIEKPEIACKIKGIYLNLCQREYLSIVINKEENGKITTIYNGAMQPEILDEDVEAGKEYIYSITPYYKQNIGETIILPKIKYSDNNARSIDDITPPPHVIPKEWWRKTT